MLAEKEEFPLSQKNPVSVKDKRNIIDDLFSKKVSNESLTKSRSDEKENGLMTASSTTGIDQSKASDDKAKKLSLMQDLFGSTLHMSPLREPNVNKKFVQPEQEVLQYTMEVSKTQSQHSTYAPTTLGTRESRRGKRTSEIINDPLGLFSSSAISDKTEQNVSIFIYI